MAERTQVLIVGGGPVGVGLGVELGLRGISCTLIERRTELQQIPKGQNLTARTLEHFYFWGLVDQLRGARVMPNNYPIGEVTAYKHLMSEYWNAPPGREQVNSYYFEQNDRLPQYRLEEVLRDRAATLPGVKMLYGQTAKKVTQDEHGVYVTVAGETWPYLETVYEADYLVGCDGGRSLVRDEVGIERRGSDFDQKMLLTVFRSKALHEALERFPQRTTYRAMDPEFNGYWMFFGRVDVGEGWFFHAPVPLDTTLDNFDFQGLLNRAAGFEFEAEFQHVGFWDLKVAVADEYQVGRVFIAGDAAHSHPPYGGFGLNNGLEDVTNLGWKLAAVLSGWGGASLLASYSEERRPIFLETGEDFIAKRISNDGNFLHTYSPEKDKAEFEREWEALFKSNRVTTYEPNYEGSSIVDGPEGAVCSAHGSHTFVARIGHHLPPRALSGDRRLAAELGAGFTLLAFDAPTGAASAFASAASALDVPLALIEDSFADEREAYAARLILVRPDQYIVWAGDELPEDLDGLLKKVVGRG